MSDSINGATTTVDLTNCEKEAIHIPGHAQNCGVMLAVNPANLLIRQVSENCSTYFGIAPESLLGTSIQKFLPKDAFEALTHLSEELLHSNPLFVSTVMVEDRGPFNMIAHTHLGVLIVEFEEAPKGTPAISDFHQIIRTAINRLKGASGLADFAQQVADEMHRIIGFDRVMVYQFQDDHSGKVIAEQLNRSVTPESFLGLRYPASDIPSQARRLFLDNIVRVIPEIGYKPAALVPPLNPDTGEPLDMTHAFLRGVSPIHIEYLENMGVQASLTLALERDGQLWGLVACHHYSPRKVDYTTRTACEFLAHSVSLQLTSKEDQEHAEYQRKSDAVQASLMQSLATVGNIREALASNGNVLLNKLIRSDGVLLIAEGQKFGWGTVPPDEIADEISSWLADENRLDNGLYATSNLAEASAGRFGTDGRFSGLLALSLGSHGSILWYRKEQVQEVTWAGNPDKPMETSEDGIRLSPRKSFEAWTEQVRNQSQPWLDVEKKAVRRLELTIKEVVLRKTEELEKLNAELLNSNVELDSFAYIASHDLKEPLRGIHNYSQFLLEDYSHVLDSTGVERLQTLGRLSQRMENLLDSLLYYSRAGRVEMAMADTDLNSIVEATLAMLQYSIEEKNVQIVIPRPLPTVYVDRVRIGEVFLNLISNALKYTDSENPTIEIGWQEDAGVKGVHGPLFYVKDNGIGINARSFDAVFKIFKRLHGRNKYGGGTGAGLAITKKIIERHNGKIWVESEPGKGSTFFFTLTDESTPLQEGDLNEHTNS